MIIVAAAVAVVVAVMLRQRQQLPSLPRSLLLLVLLVLLPVLVGLLLVQGLPLLLVVAVSVFRQKPIRSVISRRIITMAQIRGIRAISTLRTMGATVLRYSIRRRQMVSLSITGSTTFTRNSLVSLVVANALSGAPMDAGGILLITTEIL